MATDAQNEGELQPDDNPELAQNSAFTDSQSRLTQSLRSSLLESVQENGRGYHRYKGTSGQEWFLPEDDLEQDRLDLQHEIQLYSYNGKLYQAPIGQDVRRVLDLGTGTGIWAIDFAEDHPEAEVIGTDLSPVQPKYIPTNCKFEIDDFNSEWTFNQSFDFIHARGLTGTSKDFPAIIRKAYDALSAGGWIEMSDIYVPSDSIDNSIKGTAFELWTNRQHEACAKIGIDTTAAAKYKQWITDQGFRGVTEKQYKWPIGPWAKDSRAKYLGKMNQMNMITGMEGFTLRLWTGVLGMPAEEVQRTLTQVVKDLQDPKLHAYLHVYVDAYRSNYKCKH